MEPGVHWKRAPVFSSIAILASACIALCVLATAEAQHHEACTPNYAVFQEGEELVYDVRYLGISLGSIVSRITRIDSSRGFRQIFTEALIRTNRGVPFVTLNTRFRSVLGDSLESAAFNTKEYLSDYSAFKHIEYVYSTRENRVYINEYVERHPRTRKRDTLDLEHKLWQDGLSLLYYARAFAHNSCERDIPVLMYRSKATTSIRFGISRGRVNIKAVRYPVAVNKLDGETGFTGIFGLTGDFEGWFSDDAASIPISAKMHVLIGSVRLELVEWKRAGWKPPRASS